MTYHVIDKFGGFSDEARVSEYSSFGEAKKYLDEQVDEMGEYFNIESVSRVFYKAWHRDVTNHRYVYAGCIYIKKVA